MTPLTDVILSAAKPGEGPYVRQEPFVEFLGPLPTLLHCGTGLCARTVPHRGFATVQDDIGCRVLLREAAQSFAEQGVK